MNRDLLFPLAWLALVILALAFLGGCFGGVSELDAWQRAAGL